TLSFAAFFCAFALVAFPTELRRSNSLGSFQTSALMLHAPCTSGAGKFRKNGGVMMAALVALQSLCTSGCQMFRHQGPVSKSVAEARQLSQRGLGAMERGDMGAAEKLLGDAVKACPTDI